ncbi:MAG TPA: branched-chain amino acid ABC transporter permease [Ilumatobacteraceae bacterium]|nr:branched-chain amino acid ABC transporter permease [Ilumatobacteraceae bacterium]
MDWNSIISNAFRSGISQQAIIFALAAIGLNLHFGYTGLLNFGQIAFMAVGAYGVGITTDTFGAPLWVGIVVGILAGILLGLLMGLPTLRLRADYLAIVTIAVGEIIRLTVRAATLSDITGGSNGINGFANSFQEWNPLTNDATYGFRLFDRLNLEFSGADLYELIVGWTLVLISVFVVWRLVKSPWGRVLRSVREDEDAATALGKNVYRFKMQSLILGGSFGTLAGMFYAIQQNAVQPDNYATQQTFFALTAAILGGLATIWGPVLGAMLFWVILSFIENVLIQLIDNGIMPDSIMERAQVGPVRFMLVGLTLMLLMIFRPQGIFGDKREIAIDARK